MFKRTTAAVLWFFGTWAICDVAAILVGFPRELMLVPAVIAGIAIWMWLGRVLEHAPGRGPHRRPSSLTFQA